MSRQIQIRRGTAAEHATFTGAIGEITMDTTNKTIRVHDGTTAGGVPLAKQSEIPDLTTADYVIASQTPTAENNYTWYRKYKSGWVEQGGITNTTSSNSVSIVFPKQMKDDKYVLSISAKTPQSTNNNTVHGCHYVSKNASNCSVIALAGNSGDWVAAEINWYICGVCN